MKVKTTLKCGCDIKKLQILMPSFYHSGPWDKYGIMIYYEVSDQMPRLIRVSLKDPMVRSQIIPLPKLNVGKPGQVCLICGNNLTKIFENA
jgi:hypothetical protein